MRQRILTGLIAAPLVLALITATNPFPLILAATVCVYFAAEEIWWMFFQARSLFPLTMTALFGASSFWVTTQRDGSALVWVLLGAYCLAIGVVLSLLRKSQGRQLLAPTMAWVMAPLLGLMVLKFAKTMPGGAPFSWNPILLAIVPVWIGDICAMLVGKRFGKHPLWPEISPGKTWEGAKACLVGSIAAALIVGPLVHVSLWVSLLCGALAGVLGIYGDLFESAIKRAFGAKDSGGLFPGHGGLLDRIDSLLMPALPISAVLLLLK